MKEKHCTLLFLRRNDEILLAMKKRGFGANRYNGVGGKIEPDETLREALVRECQEEIGVTPLNYYEVAEHNFYGNTADNPFHMHVYAFFCDKWDGEPAETEEMAPEWYKLSEIPYDKMWSDDIYWLPLVLEGKKIHGEFHFGENDSLASHHLNEVDVLPFEAAETL